MDVIILNDAWKGAEAQRYFQKLKEDTQQHFQSGRFEIDLTDTNIDKVKKRFE